MLFLLLSTLEHKQMDQNTTSCNSKSKIYLGSGSVLFFRRPYALPMANPVFLSYGDLKLMPFWDPMRGDPRFEQIVASLALK